MKSLFFSAAMLLSTTAFGATFGADGGCQWDDPDFSIQSDGIIFFDGHKRLDAWETFCTLTPGGIGTSVGDCELDGATAEVSFTIVETPDGVSVSSADYGTWALQRCDP